MSDSLTTTGGMTAVQLEQQLAEHQKVRDLMDKFVKGNLQDGVDYAPAFKGSKPTLLKPGSEKVCLLLNLRPAFMVDKETHELLGEEEKHDNICYICRLYSRTSDQIVAEGRGSCSIKSKRSDVNTAIKIAQKRAQMDATLRVAALSDRFTQDLDDMDNPPQGDKQSVAFQAPQVKGATSDMVREITDLCRDTKTDYVKLAEHYKVQGVAWPEIAAKSAIASLKKKLSKSIDQAA